MKVLIIDDEEDIRTIASMSLSAIGGHDVVEAPHGQAGIKIAVAEQPDVILLDVMMPNMDGPETLAKLRNIDALRDIPVIFLTAKAHQSELDELLALGVAGVLTKPFDPTQLAIQVQKLVALS